MKELRPRRSDLDKVPEKWWDTYNPKGLNMKFYNNMPYSYDVSEIREFLALRSYHNRLSDEYYLFSYYIPYECDFEWTFVQDEDHQFINFFDLLRESPWHRKKGFGETTLKNYFERCQFCYVYEFRGAMLFLIPRYYGDRLLETGDRNAVYYPIVEHDVDKYFNDL